MNPRIYTSEEAEAILMNANRVDPDAVMAPASGPVSSEQLRAMGEEIGLTPEQIRAAEDQYLREKLEAASQTSQGSFTQFLADRANRLKSKVGSFLGLAVMLGGINVVTSPGNWWSLYPIGILGAITLSDLVKGWFNKPTATSPEFAKWQRRQNRSNQDRYVRNREAEAHLDLYFKEGASRDKLRAIEHLTSAHDFSLEDATEATQDYWRRRAW